VGLTHEKPQCLLGYPIQPSTFQRILWSLVATELLQRQRLHLIVKIRKG
jgi:hypothetical protein